MNYTIALASDRSALVEVAVFLNPVNVRISRFKPQVLVKRYQYFTAD